MSKQNFICIIVISLFLAACAPLPLKPLSYEGEVIAANTPMPQIKVQLLTGSVVGNGAPIIAPGGVAPIGESNTSLSEFGAADQQLFITSLTSELARLNIATIDEQPDGKKYNIDVYFKRTEFGAALGTYELDVSLKIYAEKALVRSFDYQLEDKMSFRNHMIEGDPGIVKNRIANTLFTQVIKDISQTMAAN